MGTCYQCNRIVPLTTRSTCCVCDGEFVEAIEGWTDGPVPRVTRRNTQNAGNPPNTAVAAVDPVDQPYNRPRIERGEPYPNPFSFHIGREIRPPWARRTSEDGGDERPYRPGFIDDDIIDGIITG